MKIDIDIELSEYLKDKNCQFKIVSMEMNLNSLSIQVIIDYLSQRFTFFSPLYSLDDHQELRLKLYLHNDISNSFSPFSISPCRFIYNSEVRQIIKQCNEDEISKIKNIILLLEDANCFIIDSSNSIIFRKRIKSSFCLTCDRMHHHGNSFVYVNINDDILLGCHRTRDCMKIGSLIPDKQIDDNDKFISGDDTGGFYLTSNIET